MLSGPREGQVEGHPNNLLVMWVCTLEKVIRRVLGPLLASAPSGGAAGSAGLAGGPAAAARAAVDALDYPGAGGNGVGGGVAGARGLQQSVTQMGNNVGAGGSGEAPAGVGSDSVCLELAILALCDVAEAVGDLVS